MQTKALATARNYEKEAVDRIRRISLAAADLEVKGTSRKAPGSNRAEGSGLEQWLDDPRRSGAQTDDSLM